MAARDARTLRVGLAATAGALSALAVAALALAGSPLAAIVGALGITAIVAGAADGRPGAIVAGAAFVVAQAVVALSRADQATVAAAVAGLALLAALEAAALCVELRPVGAVERGALAARRDRLWSLLAGAAVLTAACAAAGEAVAGAPGVLRLAALVAIAGIAFALRSSADRG